MFFKENYKIFLVQSGSIYKNFLRINFIKKKIKFVKAIEYAVLLITKSKLLK